MVEGDLSAPSGGLQDTLFRTVQSGHSDAITSDVDDDDHVFSLIIIDDQKQQKCVETIPAWIEAFFHDGEKEEEKEEEDEEGELEDDETASAWSPTEAVSFSIGQGFTTIIQEDRREFSSAEPNVKWLNSSIGDKAYFNQTFSEHCTASQNQADNIFQTVQSGNDAVTDFADNDDNIFPLKFDNDPIQSYKGAITDDAGDHDYIFARLCDNDTVQTCSVADTDAADDNEYIFQSFPFDNDTEKRKDDETTDFSWIDGLFSDEDEAEQREETEKENTNLEKAGEADMDEKAAEFDIVAAAWNEASMLADEDEIDSEQKMMEEGVQEEILNIENHGQDNKTAMSRKKTGAERLSSSGNKTTSGPQERREELSTGRPHTRPYDPKRPHQCRDCHMCFDYFSKLKKHQVVHTKVKAFVCQMCGRAYSQKSGLNQHTKLFHLNEKNHQCHTCGKLFRMETALNIHTSIHTGEKPYKCTLCTKAFGTLRQQKHHVLVKHLGEKPKVNRCHICQFCNKSFYSKTHLRNHIRIHTGEHPFKCPNCDKAFKQKGEVRRHVDVVHTNNKVHTCSQCNRAFYRKELLDTHWNTHTGEKPYACSICERAYAGKPGLSTHMRRVHGIS